MILNSMTKKYIDNIYDYINEFFIDDITKIILTYLSKFENKLVLESHLDIIFGFIYNLFLLKNRIYFNVYSTDFLYIYDIDQDVITKVQIGKRIETICHYKNEIYIATKDDILLYHDTIFVKKIRSVHYIIEEIFCYKENIVYTTSNNDIILYNLINNNEKKLKCKFTRIKDCIYLYKNELYIHISSKYLIKRINIYNCDDKIEYFIDKNLSINGFLRSRMYINKSYIILKYYNNIYIFYKDTFVFFQKIKYDDNMQPGFTFSNERLFLFNYITLKVFE